MTIAVTPHLNFRGDARAALEHYRAAFGGEITAVTYAQMGGPHDPAQADLIIWGQVETASGFRVMTYDVQTEKPFSRGREPVLRLGPHDGTGGAHRRLADARGGRRRCSCRSAPPSGRACTGWSPTGSASPGCSTPPPDLDASGDPAGSRLDPRSDERSGGELHPGERGLDDV